MDKQSNKGMGNMVLWQLKKGADFRIRSGHPWVFSNELAHPPRSIGAGTLVRLVDTKGSFLAWGYGHPQSLISFRVLSRVDSDDIESLEFHRYLLIRALNQRHRQGWTKWSFRWVFSEADDYSGLIIDCFKLADGKQVWMLQPSTAGIEMRLPLVLEALKNVAADPQCQALLGLASEKDVTLVISRNSKSRLLEGLELADREIVYGSDLPVGNLSQILVPMLGDAPLSLFADLAEGQKTGFFLDQGMNALRLLELLPHYFGGHKKLRVLDLCSYVGQWSVRLAKWSQAQDIELDLHLVDVSQEALEVAEKSLAPYPVSATFHHLDVMKDTAKLSGTFDLIICDPPAFIKKKKDLPQGQAAYVKLNRDALKLLSEEGLYMTCSCSGLLTRPLFEEVVSDAARKAGKTLNLLWRGGHGPDHPVRVGFPEGEYLKSDLYLAKDLS